MCSSVNILHSQNSSSLCWTSHKESRSGGMKAAERGNVIPLYIWNVIYYLVNPFYSKLAIYFQTLLLTPTVYQSFSDYGSFRSDFQAVLRSCQRIQCGNGLSFIAAFHRKAEKQITEKKKYGLQRPEVH